MKLFTADWVCPASGPPVRNGMIAVDGSRIVRVGPASGIPGADATRFDGCVIIPGFVNAHTHLELTILRGFLEDLPFLDWIQKLTQTKYKSLSRDALKVSAQLGAVEMLRAGVTAVGEVMDIGTGWEAMREFGLQGTAYQEVFGPAGSAAAQSLRELEKKVSDLRRQETETLRVGVSPHAPYTVSAALYEGTRDYARNGRLPLAVHIAESREEVLFVRDGKGVFEEALRKRGIEVTAQNCLPVAFLERLGLLGPETLLIHAVEIDDRDLDGIARSGAAVVHCPKSNAKLGHRIARVADMRAAGVGVGIGTDSVASNNVVDMFEEMRSAVFHQRILKGNINAMSAADAFGMATLGGARCLGLDRHLGSLEPGKRADFVVVDLGAAATQPVYDPIETLVYSASRANVKSTFIGGSRVDLDDSGILREAAAIASRLGAPPQT